MRSDKKLLIDASASIKTDDLITVDGKTYTVISVNEIKPALTRVMSICNVREGGMFDATATVTSPTTIIPDFVTEFLANNTTYSIGDQYFTSFESLSEFSQFYIVPQNHLNSATHELSTENLVSGNYAHKAYMYQQNEVISGTNTNHRAYPTFQFENTAMGILTGGILVDFWVNTDIEIGTAENENWISLATFTAYSDNNWARGFLINVDSDNIVHLMHVPRNGQQIHDIFQTTTVTLPKSQWVKITAYIDCTTANRFSHQFIAVWQDGVLVSAARFDGRINLTDLQNEVSPEVWATIPEGATIPEVEAILGLVFTGGLAQAHFGLYAAPLLSSGTIYNDDLSVTEILK